jgi:hypothetical protein
VQAARATALLLVCWMLEHKQSRFITCYKRNSLFNCEQNLVVQGCNVGCMALLVPW